MGEKIDIFQSTSRTLTDRHTHRIGKDLLRLERVDGKHGNVTDQQEGDNLTARFDAVVLR